MQLNVVQESMNPTHPFNPEFVSLNPKILNPCTTMKSLNSKYKSLKP